MFKGFCQLFSVLILEKTCEYPVSTASFEFASLYLSTPCRQSFKVCLLFVFVVFAWSLFYIHMCICRYMFIIIYMYICMLVVGY